jgi:hypothetical protein
MLTALQRINNFQLDHFCEEKKEKENCGQLKDEIHILFHGEKS